MNTLLIHDGPEERLMMTDDLLRISRLRECLEADRLNGEDALRRLLPIAQGNTGQSERVARILLGLYNGYRFPLDLTNLRSLDYEIMEDVLVVLRMDANCYQEVHRYFENGSKVFEQLASDWGFEKKASAS